MRRAALTLAVAAALAIFHASFLTAFGRPVSLINLPLIFTVSVAIGLRMAPTLAVAFVAGSIMDGISAVPYGTYTLSMIVVAVAAVRLFSSVLTHLSFFSYLGANAGAFLLFHLSVLLIGSSGRLLAGGPFLFSGFEYVLIAALAALPFQLAVCAVIRLLAFRQSGKIRNYAMLH